MSKKHDNSVHERNAFIKPDPDDVLDPVTQSVKIVSNQIYYIDYFLDI